MAKLRTQLNRVFRRLPVWAQVGVLLAIITVLLIPQAGDLEVPPASQKPGVEHSSVTPPSVEASPSIQLYRVVRVVDGDTLRVDVDGQEETVRIVGINTPETVDPRQEVECYGQEATAALRSLVQGQQVFLEPDPTQANRDRYGRLLRFVFLEGDVDVGKILIETGFAEESLYSTQPHRYYQAYLQAEAEAREAGLGLWSPNACSSVTP